MRFNPPPNWPKPEPGWTPPAGWTPPTEWGDPPHGWPLWVEDAPAPQVIVQQVPVKKRGRIGCLSVIVILLVLGGIGAIANGDKKTASTPPAAPQVVTLTSAPDDTFPSAPAPAAPVVTQPSVDPNAAHPPMNDVTVNSCSVDGDTHWASCKITITNHSSKTSNYIVTMSAESADHATKYGDMIAAVNDLAPGQSSPQTCQGFNDVPAGSVSVLTNVQRYASAG